MSYLNPEHETPLPDEVRHLVPVNPQIDDLTDNVAPWQRPTPKDHR